MSGANVAENVKKITGYIGSHSTDTTAGKSANAGETVAKEVSVFNGGAPVGSSNDITYTNTSSTSNNTKPASGSGSTNNNSSSSSNDGSLNVDAGLCYADQALKGFDDNGDGKVTTEEAKNHKDSFGVDISVAAALDDANDVVSAGEFLSLTVLQECTSTESPDGIASAREFADLSTYIASDAKGAKENLQVIYDNLIKDKDKNFAGTESTIKEAQAELTGTGTQMANTQATAENAVEAKTEAKAQTTAAKANNSVSSSGSSSGSGSVSRAGDSVEKVVKGIESTDTQKDLEDKTAYLAILLLAKQAGVSAKEAAKIMNVGNFRELQSKFGSVFDSYDKDKIIAELKKLESLVKDSDTGIGPYTQSTLKSISGLGLGLRPSTFVSGF